MYMTQRNGGYTEKSNEGKSNEKEQYICQTE